MSTNALAELITYTQAHSGPAGVRMLEFVQAYFDSADPFEIAARDPSTLFAIANAHWRLLEAARASDCGRIRVFNPTLAEDGFVSDHTVIQIVHTDMPFLVDSVTMAVNRSGRTAHWIVHPLMAVTRDDKGLASQISRVPADRASRKASSVESLIMVECDRIVSEADRHVLAIELERVLGDVTAAVQDWQAILARLHEACTQASQSLVSDASKQEGIAFLRWLEDGNFTFLGARDYDLLRNGDKASLIARADSGLGILKGPPRTIETHLPPEAVALIDTDDVVLVLKAMTRSTVHRPAWLDYIAVKLFDAQGTVVGETRFLGLYTSAAYAASIDEIPQVRQRAAQVMARAGVVPDSHAARSLQSILEIYPRDELFQIDADTLAEHAIGILRLQERQRTRVFLRRDPFGRFTSVQVFVPRDRYNTELRIRVGAELMAVLDGESLEFTPMLTDSPLARIHYLVRARGRAPTTVNLAALEARVEKLAQRWEDECATALLRAHGEGQGLLLANRFANAFPTSYREVFTATVAAEDASNLVALSADTPLIVRLYRPMEAPTDVLRFKIYNSAKVALSDSLPLLEHMGARVLDEHPYDIGSEALWIHDIGLQMPAGTNLSEIKGRFEALFVQVWCGEVETDNLNKLVLSSTLDARQISILRAYTRYFKQLGFAFSQTYIEDALIRHAPIAQDIIALFQARFDPQYQGDRELLQTQLQQKLESSLSEVASLDDDRILRQFFASVRATARTNAWQRLPNGEHKPYLSFKLKPRKLPGVPEPKPAFEIWVYAPRFEGVHLRGGKVARGGLRWSDRREDFRTEVLGLVKAQQVKNTVIVPVGSKGGFVLKKAPASGEREALQAEGVACYRMFLSGMLDITDNIIKGTPVPPAQVVRHDEDDPYLVVAADKGTARFSDIANAISADYGFWLGDAFASGGSVGYDHKEMGITARGAWESVKRHFRALGVNTQTTEFTVAGIGDMSGDVFGNGMLQSRKIRLLLAFDHRHIFLDPEPDVERSWQERQRLFELPRSSWEDYDKSLISKGGGVYPRSAKSIRLSPQALAVLDIDSTEMAPSELLRAILQAPVDLLYNGGIGTYIKSSHETHAQVGDKAGDAFRVDGKELRCKVLVEGGNLGATQRGRIEYAQSGGLVYTDAIDNSAGVDCSDHEVNIKVLLGQIVESGDLTLKQRNELLASMTDEVAELVLDDNYYQTQALEIAAHRPLYLLDGQQRLMQWLEGAGRLNRAIEYLPGDQEIAQRRARKQGLTAPEGAVVLAYAKMSVFDDLLASNLPDDPYFTGALKAYFPKVLSERFATAINNHPLKREIIATYTANTILNRTGATFVNFLVAESVATTADVVRAFTLAREVFDLARLWDQIDALDYKVPAQLQLDLLSKLTAIAQAASRWMLRARADNTDLPQLISRYQPGATTLRVHLDDWLPDAARISWQAASDRLCEAGVETALAHDLSALEFIFPALDLVNLAQSAETTLELAARTYFAVDTELGLTAWRTEINRLPTDTLWQTQARGSARDDVYSIASQITLGLLSRKEELSDWRQRHDAAILRLNKLLTLVATQPADLAPVSVAMRELRQLS